MSEPYAACTIDLTGAEWMSRDIAGIEKIAAQGSNGPTEVIYLYAGTPPASLSEPSMSQIEAAIEAYKEGEYRTDEQVLASVTAIVRAALSTAAGTPPASKLVAVKPIECVSYEKGYEEEANPVYRIEIDGYCVDFEHREAADNFANAINGRIRAAHSTVKEGEKP